MTCIEYKHFLCYNNIEVIILITLKDIKDVITEENLDNYYLMREEELSILTPEERKRRSERTKEYKVNYEDILNAIDNIPPCFEETKENIIKTIENYLEKDKALQSYDNERFYKVGFIDAIRLMLGAQNFKRD